MTPEPQPQAISHRWPAQCEGPGLWFVIHDRGGPAGLIFMQEDHTIGMIPFRPTPLRPRFIQAVVDAAVEGDTTPEHVFDLWAATESRTRYAGPMHVTERLEDVAAWVEQHGAPPVTR